MTDGVECPYCGRPAEFLHGGDVFPYLPHLATKGFYVCRPCDARVGCHPGTDEPLGTLANRPLRQLRMAVHRAFDPRWQTTRAGKRRRRARLEAYTWLAERLGIPVDDCHVGQFNEDQCQVALEVLRRSAS